MFDAHADKPSLTIKINIDILTDFTGFFDRRSRKLNQGGIRVRKIFDLHSFMVRSKVEGAPEGRKIVVGRWEMGYA